MCPVKSNVFKKPYYLSNWQVIPEPTLLPYIANHENRILQSLHSFYSDHAKQITVDFGNLSGKVGKVYYRDSE